MKSNRPARGFTSHLETLFGAGTCVGLSDGQLLARFIADREEAGELAFEALVTRHGPMVMRVCQNILDDPQDVHDAFQAVFLVWPAEPARSATWNRSEAGCMGSPCG